MREITAIIYTLTDYEFLVFGSNTPTFPFTDHKPIIILCSQKSKPNHKNFRFQLILIKIPNLHIFWIAGRNVRLPDTLSRITPPEFITRKTTVEIPENIYLQKLLLAKRRYIAQLESKYAVKTEYLKTKYLDCQDKHYELDLLGISRFKPIPYSSSIKNNSQQNSPKQKLYRINLFPLLKNKN